MTPNKSRSAKKSLFWRIKNDVLFHAPRMLGGWLFAIRLPILALLVLKFADNNGNATFRMLQQLERASRACGNASGARKYQQRLRQSKLRKYTKERNFPKIFALLADLEKAQQPGPIEVGRLISKEIVKESGRRLLLKAARPVRKKHPRSVYLMQIVTMCEAMQGDYRAAAQKIERELARPHLADNPKEKRRFTALRNCWRTVDLIARNQMDIVAEVTNNALTAENQDAKIEQQADGLPENEPGLLESAEFSNPVEAIKAPEQPQQLLRFKEHYLQGRQHVEYLEACDHEFALATTLLAKFRIIGEMLRQGVRRVSSYADAYDLATTRLRELIADDPGIFERTAVKAGNSKQVLTELVTMLQLTRKLEMTEESAIIVQRLLYLSKKLIFKPLMFAIAANVAEDRVDLEHANRIMANVARFPLISQPNVKGYFRWATLAGRYNQADAAFEKLNADMRLTPAVLDYVNILERRGNYDKALEITYDVYGHLLANPARINSILSHRLINRIGELRFLAKTASLFKSVPQPTEPKGVVLLTPRNIGQLRLHPLIVLNEMKKQGWAVIPTVEGMLPRQLTGNPVLDVMNGAIMRTTAIHPGRTDVIQDVEDFEFDAASGKLRWKNIDLSHSIWEDSAINRRLYNVDYGCPALRSYLTGLTDWTRSTARVLEYANKLHKETGIKVATMALYNSRLPDSLHRAYCNEYGNPDSFFALHAANGYQNYFTNFATNVSQRFVLRNVTRANEVRSASFPIPENFDRYYRDNQDRLPEMLERFAGVTKIKRSTTGLEDKPPEVAEASDRIAAWRARGGKIVCAFGKVVCDSSVPFDGGPAHANMKDWINDCVRAVKDSNTLLLIKPHPHELNNSIATFPNEFFTDLITEPLNDNVMVLGHRWFDMYDMKDRMDLGLIYNGTTAIELGIMGIPCVLAGHFAPIDYPIGHAVPRDKQDFRRMLRFEKPVVAASDIKERAACWLDYMANERFTLSYRYHSRPVTNRTLYPPTWFSNDLKKDHDEDVVELAARALGLAFEPGGEPRTPDVVHPIAVGA